MTFNIICGMITKLALGLDQGVGHPSRLFARPKRPSRRDRVPA